MTRRLSLLDMLTVATVAALLAAAVWIAVQGPTTPLPMHFGLDGRPDRWGDRNELAGLVGFLAVILGLTAGGMGWYAARTEDTARRRGLRIGQLLSLLVIGALAPIMTAQILSVAADPLAASGPQSLAWPMALLAIVCLVTGALLGRVPPNVAVGVRTPWSLKSRLAWDRSNRLFGRLMFWTGLLGLVATPFAPQPLGLWGVFAAMMIAAVWSVFESWRVWRADPDRQPF